MDVAAIKSLLENARIAARLMGSRSVDRPEAPPKEDFPEPQTTQAGLRGLEETQALHIMQSKGSIIDRLL